MAKWTSRDIVEAFSNRDCVYNTYKRRFQAFVLHMITVGDMLKEVNPGKPSKENLQTAFSGVEEFETYGELVEYDAALRCLMLLNRTDNNKIDYEKLDKALSEVNIDSKFLRQMKEDSGYNTALGKLESIQEKAESDAKAEIQKGGNIEFSDQQKKIVAAALGDEVLREAEAAQTKYKTWKKIQETGAIDQFVSSKEGGKFWGKGTYDSLKTAVGDAKNKAYDTVMGSTTNILTAPLKIFFFGLHELLNPNSYFRKAAWPKIKENMRKVRENKQAQDEYKKLGLDLDNMNAESEAANKKTFSQSVQQLQRTVMKGWKFEDDLQVLGVQPNEEPKGQKEQPQQEQPRESMDLASRLAALNLSITSSDLVNEATIEPDPEGAKQEENEQNSAADAGEDENPQQQEPVKQQDENEKIQEKVANVILRYNFLIYLLLRAFAGTYGHQEAFRQFSFQPFTIKNSEEAREPEKKPEQKQEETKSQDQKSELTDEQKSTIQKTMHNFFQKDKWSDLNDGQKKMIAARVRVDPAKIDQALSESMVLEAEEQHTQQEKPTFVFELTHGVEHWIKKDPVLSRMIQRNVDLKRDLIKDGRYSTFYAIAQFFDEILDQYTRYISALKAHAQFNSLKSMNISITGIKNLKLQEVTAVARKSLTALRSKVQGFGDELNREFRIIASLQSVTNVTQFLAIKDCDFTNIEKFIKTVDPRLEQAKRVTAQPAKIYQEDAKEIFGENGIPFSVINLAQTEEKKEAQQQQPQQQQQQPQQQNTEQNGEKQ
jgi:hypothetical protein